MGTPKTPRIGDGLTLIGTDGTEHLFSVVYVDEDIVVCESFSKLAHFSRDEFEQLFDDSEVEK